MTDEERARTLYSEGVLLYSSGEYEEAIAKWKAVTAMQVGGQWRERAAEHIARAQRILDIVAGAPVTPPAPVDPQVRQLYSEGVALYSRGEYQKAIDKWTKLLAHPNAGSLADKTSGHIARAKGVLDLGSESVEERKNAWQALADWLVDPSGAMRHVGGEGHDDPTYVSGTRCWCGEDHGPHNHLGGTTCWCGEYNDYIGTPR